MSNLPLYIDDTPALSPQAIHRRLRQMQRRHPIGLVVIDYLQLMTWPYRVERREQEVAKISNMLKAMAKTMDITIIVLSQLNRNAEGRPDRKPQLSDLRESGAIEQDCDVALLLWRPELYGTTDVEGFNVEGMMGAILAKQRNGPVGMLWLQYDVNTQFIGDLAPAYREESGREIEFDDRALDVASNF